GAPARFDLEQFSAEELIESLQDWETYLQSDPVVSRKLFLLHATDDTSTSSPSSPLKGGPKP
ncbi:hypothetical protein, partial [Tritonibacter mobilis]|uniref:hypothetical protein n=1 Tax=Tritonibacter mobilis TaxID=379347 RepID=UPI0019550F0D